MESDNNFYEIKVKSLTDNINSSTNQLYLEFKVIFNTIDFSDLCYTKEIKEEDVNNNDFNKLLLNKEKSKIYLPFKGFITEVNTFFKEDLEKYRSEFIDSESVIYDKNYTNSELKWFTIEKLAFFVNNNTVTIDFYYKRIDDDDTIEEIANKLKDNKENNNEQELLITTGDSELEKIINCIKYWIKNSVHYQFDELINAKK